MVSGFGSRLNTTKRLKIQNCPHQKAIREFFFSAFSYEEVDQAPINFSLTDTDFLGTENWHR